MSNTPVQLLARTTPEIYRGSAQRATLVHRLQEADTNTVLMELTRPEQICLSPNGTTIIGQLRLTSVAMRQLCSFLAVGLGRLIADLIGDTRRRIEVGDMYSMDDAIHIFNLVIGRRFPLVAGMQLVFDSRNGTIEGIVGGRYHRLANLDLFEQVDEAMQNVRSGLIFDEAILYGRTIMLRYASTNPICGLIRGDGVDHFLAGYYYVNSESGDGSLRMFPLLVREINHTASACKTGSGGSINHQGRDFRRRLGKLISSVASWSPDYSGLEEHLNRLQRTSLGFTSGSVSQEDRIMAIASRIQAKDLTLSIGKTCIQAALYSGADGPTSQPSGSYGNWNHRSLYDLYCSVTSVAVSEPIFLREQIEHLAWSMLTGRFNPLPR